MANKINRDSPLVKCVLALDSHLAELERVGMKINSTDMTSDIDVEYVQKLMTRFTECGQGISEEVTNLSRQLQEAQARAEGVAEQVSRQAKLFNIRWNEQKERLEQFRVLGERVRELTAAIGRFRPEHGNRLTNEEGAKLTSSVAGFEAQLTSLIGELQNLRKSARDSCMKSLEKNAESLTQTLEAVRKKLGDLPRR